MKKIECSKTAFIHDNEHIVNVPADNLSAPLSTSVQNESNAKKARGRPKKNVAADDLTAPLMKRPRKI